MVGVARQAVTDHFGIDLRAARLGVLVFLEHDARRPLRPSRSRRGSCRRGRLACSGRSLKCGVQRLAAWAKPATPSGLIVLSAPPASITSASPVLDHPGGIADRVRAGRARRDHRMVRAHQAILDRDLARGEIDQPAVDEVQAETRPGPFSRQDRRFRFRSPADRRCPSRSRPRWRSLRSSSISVSPASSSACPAASMGVDDERIDLPLDLVIDPLVGIEAVRVILGFHFAGDLGLVLGGVEARDRARSRFCRR